VEKKLPKNPVGVDSKEGFTECDKAGDMQDRIRRELEKLHAIYEKKPTKKFMGTKRKAVEKKIKKHNPISARGLGDALGAGENDRRRSGEKPL
jgi:hypothetical protein